MVTPRAARPSSRRRWRQVRRAKSSRKLSMRAEVALAAVRAPAPTLDRLAPAEADLRAAGRIAKLDLPRGPSRDLTVTCEW